jgi:hypothetical protein
MTAFLSDLSSVRPTTVTDSESAAMTPRAVARATSSHGAPAGPPSWSPGELVATHDAYSATLRTIAAADPRVVAIDGEIGADRFESADSTYSELSLERYLKRFAAE